jgi:hypothetical protein
MEAQSSTNQTLKDEIRKKKYNHTKVSKIKKDQKLKKNSN